jgi:hypothetical protein
MRNFLTIADPRLHFTREMTLAVVERRDSGDHRPERAWFLAGRAAAAGFREYLVLSIPTWLITGEPRRSRPSACASVLAEPARRRIEGPILEMEFLNALP